MTRAASTLSGDEVAALMDELSDISFDTAAKAAPEPIAADEPEEVESFVLGRRSARPSTPLAHLERMNERTARRLRDVIEPIAQARTRVEALPLETHRFDEWQRLQPDHMSLSLFRVRPVKGMMMLAIEPAFITAMVDAFYGGSGSGLAPRQGEFTPSEQRLQRRLTDAIIGVLTAGWEESFPLEFHLSTHETNPAFATMVRPDEPVVVQSFSIKPGLSRSSRIEILYPLALLEPIEQEIAARTTAGVDGDDPEWRNRLVAALDSVTLPVRSVLARPEMTVAQLLELRPGDVIPVNLSQTVPLLVGNRRFAEGTIGERDGRAAMMIESLNREMLK